MSEQRPDRPTITEAYRGQMRQRVDNAQEQLVLIQGTKGMNALEMWLDHYIVDVSALLAEAGNLERIS